MAKVIKTRKDGSKWWVDTDTNQVLGPFVPRETPQMDPSLQAPPNVRLPERPSPTVGMSNLQLGLAGAGKALTDTARGVGQLTGQVSAEDVRASRERDAPLMDTRAGMVGNVIGHGAQAALLPYGTPLKAGMGAAAYGAIQPAEDNTERAINAAVSGAGGYWGQRAGQWVNRGAGSQREPFERAVLGEAKEAAKRMGRKLQVTAATNTGRADYAAREAGMSTFPMGREALAKMALKNQKILNASWARAIGEAGETLDPLMIGRANERLGREFERLANRFPDGIDFTPEHFAAVRQILDDYISVPGTDVPRAIGLLDDALYDAQARGITGQQYTRWHSAWGKRIQSLKDTDPELMDVYIALTDVLDNAAEASSPQKMLAHYTKIRNQYRNLKQVEHVLDQKGNVSAKKLANRMSQPRGRGGDNRWKRGTRPQHQETADAFALTRFGAQNGEIVGDSGTALRSFPMWETAMMGGGAAAGVATGNPLLGAAVGAAPFLRGAAARAYLSPLGTAARSHQGLSALNREGAAAVPRFVGKYVGPYAEELIRAGGTGTGVNLMQRQ